MRSFAEILRKMHGYISDVLFGTDCISKRCIHMPVTNKDYNIMEAGKLGMYVASTQSNLNEPDWGVTVGERVRFEPEQGS
jgi:hypothetical protein